MREEFSAVVAHDLRSPLQAMTVPLDALLRQARSGQVRTSVATLERMRHAGARLEHLIRDLLDAARIESDRLRVDPRPVALPALAAALARQIAPTIASHPITVEVRGQPPPVRADPLRVEQVLTNLVENAAKYSKDGSPIALEIAQDGGGVAVSVADRGQGIAPEDLPRLFDRYYQTARARKQRSGLGLGLYIAKGVAEAHGGQLTVESRPEVGSTFRLWLPADRGELAEGSEVTEPA
ncbi:MAG: HAMP domain-containing sensor histidine kinase [Myxococcales bacterium]